MLVERAVPVPRCGGGSLNHQSQIINHQFINALPLPRCFRHPAAFRLQ
jgi:hypothetical protein